jgi:hypothetical protein
VEFDLYILATSSYTCDGTWFLRWVPVSFATENVVASTQNQDCNAVVGVEPKNIQAL